mgnify:FL=1
MNGTWEKTNKIYDLCDGDYTYLNSYWNEKFRLEILRLLKQKKVVDKDFTDLENIHKNVLDTNLLDYDFNSGVNGITKKLYDIDDSFMNTYYSFVKYLYETLNFNFYFQEIPTIRVHCPKAKNENHYPRYHNDVFYGHPPEELNIWFSLTQNKNSGFKVIDFDKSKRWFGECDNDVSGFIDKAINNTEFNKKGDELSFEVKSDLKSIFVFNSLCIHTNKPRLDDSRVSIDVRINPVSDFVDGYVGAGRMKAEFKPDGKFGYYKKSIEEML